MTLEEILANPTQLVRQLALLESDEGDSASLQLAEQVRAAVASRPELAAVQAQVEAAPILNKPDRVENSLKILEQAGQGARASELRERIRRRQEVSQIQGRPDTTGGIADGLSVIGDGLGFVGSRLADLGRGAVQGMQNFGQAIQDNEFFAGGGVDPNQGINQGRAIANSVLDRVAPERQLEAALAALTSAPEPTPQGAAPTTQAVTPTTLLGTPPAINPATAYVPQPVVNPLLAGVGQFPDSMAIQQQAALAPDPRLAGLTAERQAIDAAIMQQAMDGLARENQRRAFETFALQQVPTDNRNILGNAAAFSQQPAIGAAPANIASTIPLAQSIAGDITVPDQTQAAQTNLNQQNRTARIEDKAENALLQERLKALELARQSFIEDIALPTMFRPR